MGEQDKRPMRDQLIEARSKITAQLDALRLRCAPGGRGNALPPDFHPVIAELENELCDIDRLLDIKDDGDPA